MPDRDWLEHGAFDYEDAFWWLVFRLEVLSMILLFVVSPGYLLVLVY